jgi:ABC-type Fe3+/spermidine/putrescine transport system ATPase subunit
MCAGSVEVRARATQHHPGVARSATALVRPEAVSIAGDGEAAVGPLVGRVIAVAFLGAVSRVTVDLGDTTVLAQLPTSAASEHPAGSKVRLTLRSDPVLIQREEPAPAGS